MKKLLLAFVLLAGCQQQEGQKAGDPTAVQGGATAQKGAKAPRIGSLVGLYEGGAGQQKNQMCVVEGEGGDARFGLVVWGGNMHSCSGAGTLDKQGATLRMAMDGDSACTIEATISGKSIRLPDATPEGCSYYCGARARLGGAELTQTGATEADAMKAKDLVGDPLCGGEAG